MEWISVEDRVPEHCQKVITRYERGVDLDVYFSTEGRFMYDNLRGRATHWMPLPEVPEPLRWVQVDKWRVRCPKCGEVRADTEPRKYCPECGVRLEVAE